MWEYQNIKIFLQMAMFQIGLAKIMWLKKLKILCHRHVISAFNSEEINGIFYEK